MGLGFEPSEGILGSRSSKKNSWGKIFYYFFKLAHELKASHQEAQLLFSEIFAYQQQARHAPRNEEGTPCIQVST